MRSACQLPARCLVSSRHCLDRPYKATKPGTYLPATCLKCQQVATAALRARAVSDSCTPPEQS